MPNVLEVQIVGDISSLEKSLKTAETLQAEYTASISKTSKELAENIAISKQYARAIDELNKEYKNGSISSKEYTSQLDKLKKDEKETAVATADLRKELANLKKDQKDVGNGIGKDFTPKIANGSNALIQFSRIAQDAPFGIMGIGNNITATAESFGYLSKQAGGTVPALKAVAGSLLGSGGVLLAVSLVTTGLTYMAQKGLTVSDVFEKLNGTFDEFGNSIKKANEEAAKSASSQISEFKAYASAVQDSSIPLEQRLIAVKKLRDIAPFYLKDLSDEKILYGDLSGVINNVTTALTAQARAKAYGSLLDEKAAEQVKLFTQVQEDLNNAVKVFKIPTDKINDFQKAIKGGTGAILRFLTAADKSPITPSDFIDFSNLESLSDKYKELGKLNGDAYKLGLKIAQETKTGLPLSFTEPSKPKEIKIDVTPKVTAIPKLEAVKTTDEQNEKILKILRDGLSEDLNKLKTEGIEINIPLQAVTDSFNFSDYAKKLEQAKKDTQIFADGAGSAISQLANDLTSSLQTGNTVLDAFVGSVIKGLADIATAQLTGLIAKQAVATASLSTDAAVSTGNAVTAATETAAASGPAAAFVLPALVGAAIGFIAASFSGIKFAHGGVVPGGSFTGDKIPAMLNSGEVVFNSQQQANTLMAIANGNSNSLQGNRKSSIFNFETKLRGSDLLLAIKREEKGR